MKDVKPYKGLSGGLFDGEPLRVVKDPSMEIRAQQAAESLRSLVIGECAIPERLWPAVRLKLGYDDEPTEEWKQGVIVDVKFCQECAASFTEYDNGKKVPPIERAKYLQTELLNLAKRLMVK